jgi:hypothetical protein
MLFLLFSFYALRLDSAYSLVLPHLTAVLFSDTEVPWLFLFWPLLSIITSLKKPAPEKAVG